MRTLLALTTLALLSATLALPGADAFTWCTRPGAPGHTCSSHVVCIGWSTGPTGERCQYGVGPCDPVWCDPYVPCRCIPLLVTQGDDVVLA